jgi:hypothetical protein
MTKIVDVWTDNSTKLKLSVHSLGDNEDMIKTLFRLIIEDYCKRYEVINKYPKARINISFIIGSGNESSDGSCSWAASEELMYIQLWDPVLSGHEETKYVSVKMIETICHEFTHAAQFLTERKTPSTKGYKGKNSGLVNPSYDGSAWNDDYMFNPNEVEARVMESYFASKFGFIFGDGPNELAVQTVLQTKR